MKRIQRRRTKGWRMPPDAVYVGRPSRWGNPWMVGSIDLGNGVLVTAEAAVEMYRMTVANDLLYWPGFLDPLVGHDLACWCHLCDAHRDGLPLGVVCPDCAPCHADVLLEVAP